MYTRKELTIRSHTVAVTGSYRPDRSGGLFTLLCYAPALLRSWDEPYTIRWLLRRARAPVKRYPGCSRLIPITLEPRRVGAVASAAAASRASLTHSRRAHNTASQCRWGPESCWRAPRRPPSRRPPRSRKRRARSYCRAAHADRHLADPQAGCRRRRRRDSAVRRSRRLLAASRRHLRPQAVRTARQLLEYMPPAPPPAPPPPPPPPPPPRCRWGLRSSSGSCRESSCPHERRSAARPVGESARGGACGCPVGCRRRQRVRRAARGDGAEAGRLPTRARLGRRVRLPRRHRRISVRISRRRDRDGAVRHAPGGGGACARAASSVDGLRRRARRIDRGSAQ